MGGLFSYSLSSALVLLLLYPVYKVFMAGERYYRVNRFILWGLYLAALILPLLPETYGAVPVAVVPVDIVTDIPEMEIAAAPAGNTVADILLLIYLAGVAVTSLVTLIIYLTILRLWRKSPKEEIEGRTVAIVPRATNFAPFSFCNRIFIPQGESEAENAMILRHELSHIRHCHCIDLFWAQLFCIFQWYNPAAWLMRREFQEVHEYEADLSVLQSGVSVREYQILLIKKAVGKQLPALANSLNHSKLKKRITMMSKSEKKMSRYLRIAAIVPAAAAAIAVSNLDAVASAVADAGSASVGKVTELFAEAQTLNMNVVESDVTNQVSAEINGESVTPAADNVAESPSEARTVNGSDTAADASADEVAKTVEVMPEFPGGEAAMFDFIAKNIKYPAKEFEEEKNGRVIVGFTITETGKVTKPEIMRSSGSPEFDAEAIRLVNILPDFIPGSTAGKPVAVKYSLPFTFKTKTSKTPLSLKTSDAPIMDVYLNGKYMGPDFNVSSLSADKIDSMRIDRNHTPARIYISIK